MTSLIVSGDPKLIYSYFDSEFKKKLDEVTKRHRMKLSLIQLTTTIFKVLHGEELTEMDILILKILREVLNETGRLNRSVTNLKKMLEVWSQ